MPSMSLASGSYRISATTISATSNQTGLLLVYENPWHQLNIIYGNGQTFDGFTTWKWRNVTDDWNTQLLSTYPREGDQNLAFGDVARTCSVGMEEGSSDMFCLVSDARGPTEARSSRAEIARLSITPSGDLNFTDIGSYDIATD